MTQPLSLYHDADCRSSAARTLRTARSGISIIEVLFAIGIVVVGLVGIASLLPLAGQQASQSARAAESQALAQDWYSELFTRQIHKSSSWIFYQDLNGTFGGQSYTPGYANYNSKLGAIKGGTPSTSMGRSAIKQAVCIDPLFFADADMTTAIASGAFVQPQSDSNDRWYRPSVFPYYQDRYNPTIDPAYAVDPNYAWGDQPRMVRVTFDNGGGSPVSMKYVEQIFASQDELSITVDPSDRSISAVRTPTLYGVPTAGSTTIPIARAATQTNYSWIATLSPNETFDDTSVDFGTLSLLVLHKRDRLFYNPKNPVTAPTLRSGAPTPDAKPLGERLAWVLPISGDFQGGTGGRVRIIGSDGVPDTLHIGDWMMLSKFVSVSGVTAHPVFRWYRVIASDAVRYAALSDKPFDFTVQASSARIPLKNFPSGAADKDPYGLAPPAGDQVWARDVVLEGPDWDFTISSGSVTTPTTATIVHGAVAVIERIVELK